MVYDLIILGGGPAGIAAGVYAARKKLKVLIIAESFGGQSVIAAQINNFIGFKSISGVELKNTLENHLRDQNGIEIKEGVKVLKIEKIDSKFLISVADESFESKTLLIAMGSGYKRLNVAGEKEFEGKGVFYCSICDAPLMNGRAAAVIGGGNSGLYAALDLIPYAEKIYVLEYSDAFRADQVYIDKAKESGKVEFIAMAATKEIVGDKFVSNIKYEDKNSGEIKNLKVDGVFVAIGYQPNSALVKDIVDLNEKRKIIVDCKTQMTSCEGIWAAGDITDVLYGQINIAIGDAVKAILNINDYLKTNK